VTAASLSRVPATRPFCSTPRSGKLFLAVGGSGADLWELCDGDPHDRRHRARAGGCATTLRRRRSSRTHSSSCTSSRRKASSRSIEVAAWREALSLPCRSGRFSDPSRASRPKRLARVLEPRTMPADRRPSALLAVEQALGVTSRFIRHTCYTRGITRYYVLRRAGFDVSLVFGIERETASPGGHCWILLDGDVYQESIDPTERFVRRMGDRRREGSGGRFAGTSTASASRSLATAGSLAALVDRRLSASPRSDRESPPVSIELRLEGAAREGARGPPDVRIVHQARSGSVAYSDSLDEAVGRLRATQAPHCFSRRGASNDRSGPTEGGMGVGLRAGRLLTLSLLELPQAPLALRYPRRGCRSRRSGRSVRRSERLGQVRPSRSRCCSQAGRFSATNIAFLRRTDDEGRAARVPRRDRRLACDDPGAFRSSARRSNGRA